jgi:cellulose synthase/poly-beta-1,6-N-acetylglucosamine synthase-like glycosyltransferase
VARTPELEPPETGNIRLGEREKGFLGGEDKNFCSGDPMPPVISVIIPAYNAAGSIGECLEALLHQSVEQDDYEIIVVDDGSTDGTEEIARAYGVHVFSQPNQGPTAARNQGVAQARGDILLFTDADCMPAENWIEEMVRPLSDPEVVGVKGAYATRQRGLIPRFIQLEFEDRYRLLRRDRYIDFVDTHAAAFKKQVFDIAGGFDPSIPGPTAEDADLSYRISSLGYKMVFNPKAIVYHRHPERWGEYLWVKFWRSCWRMSAYRKHPDKMIRDSYTPQVLKIQIILLYAVVGGLIGILFFGGFGWVALGALVLLSMSTVPFAWEAWQKDRTVGLIAPLILISRSAAFSLGVIVGLAISLTWHGTAGRERSGLAAEERGQQEL